MGTNGDINGDGDGDGSSTRTGTGVETQGRKQKWERRWERGRNRVVEARTGTEEDGGEMKKRKKPLRGCRRQVRNGGNIGGKINQV